MKNQLGIGMKGAAQKSAIFRRKIHFEAEIKMRFPFGEADEPRSLILFYFALQNRIKKRIEERGREGKEGKEEKKNIDLLKTTPFKCDNKYKIILR